MLAGSGFSRKIQLQLWTEAANTATLLDSYLITDASDMNSYQKFFGKGKRCPVTEPTKKFGEPCIVSDRTKIKSKLQERGKEANWIGYTSDHAAYTYRIFNPKTRKVILSRDVTFIGQKVKQAKLQTITMEKQDESDSDEEILTDFTKSNLISDDEDSVTSNNESINNEEDNDDFDLQNQDDNQQQEDSLPQNVDNPKVIRAMKNLQASYNPDAQKILDKQSEHTKDPNQSSDDSEIGRDESQQNAEHTELPNLITDIADIAMPANESEMNQETIIEPKNFNEAWFHSDPTQKDKWREAILKEHRDMDSRQVWRKIKRSDIPKDRRLVKSRWVFKVKRNGVFRARLVACGYSQIPGVDYSANYSPVINDITFRMLLLTMMYFGLSGKIVDVETAFLYGDLEEEIFMECPPGMKDVTSEDVLALQKCIYGLVQAARQYHKKIVSILKSIGFTGGDMDPCLLVRKNKYGTCFIGIYVDDNLMIGHLSAIDAAIKDLKQHGLVLKVEDDFHDYLSCEIVFSEGRKKAWLGQPHLISNLEQKFGDMVKNRRTYKTPGTPSLSLVREKDESQCVSAEKQTLYRSGVGMLLYLVKHSRPDIANCVRELSKVLDGTTDCAFNEMLRIIKYVLDTKHLGLKIEPDDKPPGSPWQITCFSDSNYANDPETRRSVSGYIVYVHGVPVVWKSKAQQSVTLSSTEAEWFALSEAVKEVRFLQQLCESMQIQTQLPVIVRVDNTAAIYMSQNITTTTRTKHIDVRTKFVKEFCEDGIIKIIFVRSEDNDSDILTKNLQSELFGKHSRKLIKGK